MVKDQEEWCDSISVPDSQNGGCVKARGYRVGGIAEMIKILESRNEVAPRESPSWKINQVWGPLDVDGGRATERVGTQAPAGSGE